MMTLIIFLFIFIIFIFSYKCTLCIISLIYALSIILTLNKEIDVILFISCWIIASSLLLKVFMTHGKFSCINIVEVALYFLNAYIITMLFPWFFERIFAIIRSTIIVKVTCPNSIIVFFTFALILCFRF